MKDDEFQVTQILVKLAKIEENTKGLDKLTDKTNEAHSLANENKRDIYEIKRKHDKEISEIKANNKWVWSFLITFGLGLIANFLLNK